MHLRYRYRRGQYLLAEESRFPQWLKSLLALLLLLLLIYWAGNKILTFFGVGNPLMPTPVSLRTEERGIVSVSLQGAEDQTAEDGMSLFPDDALSTGPGAHASLRFFDGTALRLEEKTDVTVDETARGKKESRLYLSLAKGSLWITTPAASSFSGSIIRRIDTPSLHFLLPPGTEAVLSEHAVMVFSADGQGVEVVPQKGGNFIVGEGQQWHTPADGSAMTDPYAFRSALEPGSVTTFVTESRQTIAPIASAGTTSSRATEDVLTVSSPINDMLLRESTLTVRGTAGEGVTRIDVNGHGASLDAATKAFSQEVMPPEGAAEFEVKIDAYDAKRTLLGSITRHVRRDVAATKPDMPTVYSPAKEGETYRTQREEIVVRGTSPKGAAGMYVNEYKLQLFNPEKGEWSYLASTRLNNLKPGLNTYDVSAVDASGQRSDPVRLTIVWEAGEEGVVAPAATPGDATTGGAASTGSTSSIDPATLPTNAPLAAGTLTVTAPTAGTQHTETGTGILLEGKTSAQTATIWVNDYQLQLYKPGVTTWNYIASEALGNLKKGENVYTITARNDKQEIVDTLTYTVTKN